MQLAAALPLPQQNQEKLERTAKLGKEREREKPKLYVRFKLNSRGNIFWSMISKYPLFRPNGVKIFWVPPLSIFYSIKRGVILNFYSIKYRFQGTFYCPKSSKKCVCTLSTFHSQKAAINWGFKHTFYYFLWIKSTLKPTFYYKKGGDFDFLHISLQ